MKPILFSIIATVTSGWLVTSTAFAAPPFPVPPKGGLLHCKAELAECSINLTESETQRRVCEDALAQCQATAGQAFPATGQGFCFDFDGSSPNTIDCAGTGQDGDIRAGAALSYTDTGMTIIDNNTKLEWMKQDDNDTLGIGYYIPCDPASYPANLDHDCVFTWGDAFEFVATLNAYNHAGYADWRVPNVKELQSIVNYTFAESGDESGDPSVSPEFNNGCHLSWPQEWSCTMDECSCNSIGSYWSSTNLTLSSRDAWAVEFMIGSTFFRDKRNTASIRAIRGGL